MGSHEDDHGNERETLSAAEVEMKVGTLQGDFPNDDGRLIGFGKLNHSSNVPLQAARVPTATHRAQRSFQKMEGEYLILLTIIRLMHDNGYQDLHPGQCRRHLPSG